MTSFGDDDRAVLDFAQGFNPFYPVFLQNPEALLDAARRDAPVFFSPAVNAWVVTRYGDAERVLKDPELFTSRDILSITDLLSPEVAEYFATAIPMEGTLIGLDAPQHTRLRRVLSHAFTPRRVEELAPGLRTVANLLLEHIDTAEVDLLASFCYPLPLWTITRLIGIPDDEMAMCRQATEDWSDLSVAYITGVGLEEQLELAGRIVRMHERILELFDERRREPREDLLSAIVEREVPEGLSEREMLSLVPGLFLAGHETTSNVLANGLFHLLSEPGRWAGLVSDPSLIEGTIEEMARRDGSVLGLWRNVTRDTDIAGTLVPAGSRLYVSFWSANLDPERYERPDILDVARANRLHLAFGRGVHYCIGAPLARLSLRVAMTSLVERFPTLSLAEDFAPVYKPHFFLRGLSELRVTR
jgi:cytochrome P450